MALLVGPLVALLGVFSVFVLLRTRAMARKSLYARRRADLERRVTERRRRAMRPRSAEELPARPVGQAWDESVLPAGEDSPAKEAGGAAPASVLTGSAEPAPMPLESMPEPGQGEFPLAPPASQPGSLPEVAEEATPAPADIIAAAPQLERTPSWPEFPSPPSEPFGPADTLEAAPQVEETPTWPGFPPPPSEPVVGADTPEAAPQIEETPTWPEFPTPPSEPVIAADTFEGAPRVEEMPTSRGSLSPEPVVAPASGDDDAPTEATPTGPSPAAPDAETWIGAAPATPPTLPVPALSASAPPTWTARVDPEAGGESSDQRASGTPSREDRDQPPGVDLPTPEPAGAWSVVDRRSGARTLVGPERAAELGGLEPSANPDDEIGEGLGQSLLAYSALVVALIAVLLGIVLMLSNLGS
ncbi:MAG TPA: hypothetical protein VMU49_03135 [Candidatus Acidoferrales bacterium]|nr:hypothetical protein [Candidatus Acidoferrales bacterium]